LKEPVKPDAPHEHRPVKPDRECTIFSISAQKLGAFIYFDVFIRVQYVLGTVFVQLLYAIYFTHS
jgi:hypothetical protein